MSVTYGLAILAGVVGLAVGSFLNVVIWRVPRGGSVVSPPSHCPGCDREIAPRDNIPVASWLMLRGRCRHCHGRISARYPAVELLTATLFVLVALRLGVAAVLPAFLFLTATGVALAAIDIDVKRLPNALTFPAYAIGLLGIALACLGAGEPGRLLRAVIGMAALFGFYFLLALIHPKGMGFGDVKLAGVLGLYLAYLGWGELAVGAFLGFLLGGAGGILLIVLGRGGMKSKIPFGPYMLVGALLSVLVGGQLAHLYLSFTLSQ